MGIEKNIKKFSVIYSRSLESRCDTRLRPRNNLKYVSNKHVTDIVIYYVYLNKSIPQLTLKLYNFFIDFLSHYFKMNRKYIKAQIS